MISAELLDRWDRCERRFALSQRYEPKLISPLGVLYSALEEALLSSEPEQTAKDETMRIASQKELILTEINKFSTVRHLESLSGIIAVALRSRLGEMERVESEGWESALFKTSAGLHRIELVSHYDDDRLRACAHSWRVIGELAALETPITLTMVIIGPQRGGRRHSAWSKGLLHPVNKQLRFAPRNAKKNGFNESWTQVWREQQSISTEAWLGQMHKDGVLDEMILSRQIAYNANDARMISAKREMIEIADRMKGASESAPMRRSSCDEWGGCPFQNVCYSPTGQTAADFPQLYRIRDTPHGEPAKCKSAPDSGASSRLAQVVPIA